MRWDETSWSVFDTETSGMQSSARILELGVVTFERGRVVRRWSSLFCPPDIDWQHPDVLKALSVNRLTREQLQGQPRFEDVLPQILVELSTDVWVAHNFSFDQRMLSYELQRLQMELPLPKFRICTLDISRKLNRIAGNKLEEVARRFSVSLVGAHRAVADAEACGNILSAMVQGGYVPTDDVAMQRLCSEPAAGKRH